LAKADHVRAQGFYDPVNDHFTEPKHTGISYSFSADGFFEESYYRAVANRTSPSNLCYLLPLSAHRFQENQGNKHLQARC
jgi:hypothetical protein